MAHVPLAPIGPIDQPGARDLSRRDFLGLTGAGALALLLAACSSSPSGTGGGNSAFPIGAAKRAKSKPVPVTLWHSMGSNNLTTLQHLAAAFNGSQGDVKVTLVGQTGYPQTLTAYTAALSGGSLPDLVQIESVDVQLMLDSQSIVLAQDAVDADHYDLSDFLPSTVKYFTVAGKLVAMPFNISTQILYYDQNAFTRAGLDPAAPPTTFDEVQSASRQLISAKAGKYGISLKLTSSNFEDWISIGGGDFLDNGNGRVSRATAVSFGGELGTQIVEWFSSMLTSKLAEATPGSGLSGYDNLLGVPEGVAPMTIDTSAALGTVSAIVKSGMYPKVKLGIGGVPGPPGPGGVPIGGAGLYLVKASAPERQDGAWQFVKFLLEPESLATWAAGTGYLPIRQSAVQTTTMQQAWSAVPGYKVAYEQLERSPATTATAGGVSGAASQIGTDVTNMLTAIANGQSPASALSAAVQACNQAIASYNSRVSG